MYTKGFEEGAERFEHKGKRRQAAHGGTGMYELLKRVCSTDRGKDSGASVSDGSMESTFGPIHPGIPFAATERAKLLALAEEMRDHPDDGAQDGDGAATAGMTFLGQFIDHDLTLDATTELGHASGDINMVRNFRTPRLDLDCVYGGGPEVSPHLFDQREGFEGAVLFERLPGEDPKDPTSSNALDLARNRQGRALIGDPRNDENLFVSQVHGRRFIVKHNEHAAAIRQPGMTPTEVYKLASAEVLKAYHNEIVDDFLPGVVDAGALAPFTTWRETGQVPVTGAVSWDQIPDMPVEFSAAAFRFGHSMVRQTYRLNSDVVTDIFGGTPKLTGFVPVKEAHNLDLALFFNTKGEAPTAQKSRKIDTHLPPALFGLPGEVVGTGEASLAFRNLARGQITFGLPSGETMASHLGFQPIAPHPFVTTAELEGNTPLWFYILAEAEAATNGDGSAKEAGKLGQVGGSIVAGVITRLLKLHEESIARALVG